MTTSFYLAPILGITDQAYRNCFHRYFPFFDGAISPFIAPGAKNKIERKLDREFLSQNDTGMPVVPQVLAGNADDLCALCNSLEQRGYTCVNWNLGCPYPMVVRKCRGAGLLPFPQKIEEILSKTLRSINIKLSIKMRLGLDDATQILSILPRLNNQKIDTITIHGRTAAQMYEGSLHLDILHQAQQLSTHRIILNGSIDSCKTFEKLQSKFSTIHDFMIGRPALRDPFIVERLKQGTIPPADIQIKKLRAFHDDLLAQYQTQLSGDAHLVQKMNGQWLYLSHSFKHPKKIQKALKKMRSTQQYLAIVTQIFDSIPLANS